MSNISIPPHYAFIYLSTLSDHAHRISLEITDEEPDPQPAPYVENDSRNRTGLDYSGDQATCSQCYQYFDT